MFFPLLRRPGTPPDRLGSAVCGNAGKRGPAFGRRPVLALLALVLTASLARAQTPSDAILMKPWEACFGAMYEFGRFDRYWEGETLRENETIATVQRQAGSAMGILGLPGNVNLLVGGAYVATRSTQPNGGFFRGQQGFQDLTVTLKARLHRFEAENHHVDLLVSAGMATPMSDYHADYLPYSIGLGTTEWNARVMAQYQRESGLYARVVGGFLHRGLARTDREYYYNNGSYYTHDMDVPDAVEFQGILGAWFVPDHFRVELNYLGLRSLFGDDIRPYNRAQPTNRVHMDQIGLTTQYFFPKHDQVGLIGYANHVFGGRNAARLTRFGGGVTYFINQPE